MSIHTVAARAGVSVATVSRVLNGTVRVSTEREEAVRRAMAELDFVPNTNARALGSGSSKLFGLILSDITNPYFPELAKAFEEIAHAHGRDVLMADTSYDPGRMADCVRRMVQRRVDGIAVLTSELNADTLDYLRSRNVPAVYMDAARLPADVGGVRVDYALGVDLAMRHLYAQGHRRIAFVAGPSSLASADMRLKAFRFMAEKLRLSIAPDWVQEGNHQVSGGHASMHALLAAKRRPTAVMCSNDLTAIGLIAAAREAGVEVPREMSVVGFDDIDLSGYQNPPLTTLRVSREKLAGAAARMLLQPETIGSRVRITPELVIRGTVSKPIAT